MSETDRDEIEEIRERKREELQSGTDAGADESPDETPTEPIEVESEDHLRGLAADHAVVLADFYADWCGPCQMMEPTLESMAADSPAVVAKVDVDVHQHLAQQHGVRGVPTLVLFVDGEPAERLVGMQQEPQLRQLVDRFA